MQKCYNCGKEVDDNVLICPECGALVKRYGKPEPQQAEPFESQGTAFTKLPQPHAAVWQREDGKLKFSGGVTFWLVLCAIFLGYTLLGFACTLFIYRFQAAYFQTISQFQELAPLAELLQALLASVEAYPVYYLAVAALVALQFGCVIWFLASKRRLAFYILAAAAAVLTAMQLILGGGVVGQAALSVLHALGAWCTVMDINIGTLRTLSRQYNEQVNTMISTKENIAKLLPETDMVLNCVKWPKGCKDYLIDRSMLKLMEKGSVIVDISNDEQGAIESFHETTHENPRYIEEGIVHFCVSNIPGAIANSTSIAYAASVLPHFRSIAKNGVAEACVRDGFLRRSLTTYNGYLTHEETSALQNRPWIRPEEILDIADRQLDQAPPATVTRSANMIHLK